MIISYSDQQDEEIKMKMTSEQERNIRFTRDNLTSPIFRKEHAFGYVC